MFCPKCGKPVPEGGKFCGVCGAAVTAAPQPVSVAPKKAKKTFPVKKLIVASLCLVLLAGLVFGLCRHFGMKTVYLVAERVEETADKKVTTKYEYDGQGRVLSLEQVTKYHVDYMEDQTMRRDFTYDEEGRLAEVKMKFGTDTDSNTRKFTYRYDDDGHLESIKCGSQKIKVECDEDGRVLEIPYPLGGEAEYTYHKGGELKELDITIGDIRIASAYDEAGHTLESTTWVRDKKVTAMESSYDREGRLAEATARSYSDGKVISETVITYHYDKSGLLYAQDTTAIQEGASVTIRLETEDDGPRRRFRVVSVDTDDEDMLTESFDPDEIMEKLEETVGSKWFMTMEHDEHGNVLETEFPLSDATTTTEYIALRVPRSYCPFMENDPLYNPVTLFPD